MASKAGNPYGLTDQQIAFCHEYARLLHVGEAYEKAGYRFKTRNSRDVGGSVLLRNPKIRAYLGGVCGLSEVSVLNATTAIAFTPITEVIRWTGSDLETLPSDQWSDRAKLAVKRFKCKRKVSVDRETGETRTETEIEVEMYDRLSALDKLMRKLKMFPREIPTIECVSHLARKGLLLPGQAEAILDGLNEFEERLRSMSGDQVTTEQKRGISEDLAAEIRSRIMGIHAESPASVSSEIPE